LSASTLYFATSTAPLILGFVTTEAQLGYYSAAEKLIKATVAILNPASQALYPRVTATRVKSDFLALQLIRKSLLICGGISFIVSFTVLCFAKPICRLILGASFAPSAHLVQWLAPLPFLFGLMSVLGTQTMIAFDMDSAISRIMLAGAALAVPLTVLLSWRFGPSGAAGASVLIAAFMVAAMITMLHKRGLRVWLTPELKTAELIGRSEREI
jgi:PST family polysaccharide transporter